MWFSLLVTGLFFLQSSIWSLTGWRYSLFSLYSLRKIQHCFRTLFDSSYQGERRTDCYDGFQRHSRKNPIHQSHQDTTPFILRVPIVISKVSVGFCGGLQYEIFHIIKRDPFLKLKRDPKTLFKTIEHAPSLILSYLRDVRKSRAGYEIQRSFWSLRVVSL